MVFKIFRPPNKLSKGRKVPYETHAHCPFVGITGALVIYFTSICDAVFRFAWERFRIRFNRVSIHTTSKRCLTYCWNLSKLFWSKIFYNVSSIDIQHRISSSGKILQLFQKNISIRKFCNTKFLLTFLREGLPSGIQIRTLDPHIFIALSQNPVRIRSKSSGNSKRVVQVPRYLLYRPLKNFVLNNWDDNHDFRVP